MFHVSVVKDLSDRIAFPAVFAGSLSQGPTATATARYTAPFDAVWGAGAHPMDFPNNPHFSGLIGGTPDETVVFWPVCATTCAGG